MQRISARNIANSQNFLRSAALVDRLLDQSSIQPGDPVLDLGAGTGLISQRLAHRGCQVVAVEMSPSLKGANFQFGTNDPRQLLADHGWTTSKILQPGDEGANFGRFTAFPGLSNLALPLLSFVLAHRT